MVGTVATASAEVGQIIREEDCKIYRGNTTNQGRLVDDYMRNYGHYVCKGKEPTLEDITAGDLMLVAEAVAETAGGMDHWTPAGVKLWSKAAFHQLARMLNLVEKTGRWPVGNTTARAAFLAKADEEAFEPLGDRVLLMLPVTYRMWEKVRLVHFQPWVQLWQLPDMYAGVEGKGAADAACEAAMGLGMVQGYEPNLCRRVSRYLQMLRPNTEATFGEASEGGRATGQIAEAIYERHQQSRHKERGPWRTWQTVLKRDGHATR